MVRQRKITPPPTDQRYAMLIRGEMEDAFGNKIPTQWELESVDNAFVNNMKAFLTFEAHRRKEIGISFNPETAEVHSLFMTRNVFPPNHVSLQFPTTPVYRVIENIVEAKRTIENRTRSIILKDDKGHYWEEGKCGHSLHCKHKWRMPRTHEYVENLIKTGQTKPIKS